MTLFPLSEKFVSLNGEGTHSGKLAAFLRMSGCNLNCSYCDTKWSQDSQSATEHLSLEAITSWIIAEKVQYVTLTGGEPLLQPNIQLLIQGLFELGVHLDIETNGTIDPEPFRIKDDFPHFFVDYKTIHSGMNDFMNPHAFKHLKPKDIIKCVVCHTEDLEDILLRLKKGDWSPQANIYLSPCFDQIDPLKLVDFIHENRSLPLTLQLQLHKILWHPHQRGV